MNFNILVVEDEQDIAYAVKAYLNNQGYNVFIANNGVEGLCILEKETIHLSIVDIMMPKMTGLELISNLKKINHNAKFIVLSAFQEFQYAKEAISMGAENYLTKPIDEDDYLNTRILDAYSLEFLDLPNEFS